MIFEIIINFMESVLCVLFIKKALRWKKVFQKGFLLCGIFLTIFITILNNMSISVAAGTLLHNLLVLVFILIVAQNPISQKLVCFGANTVILTVADTLAAEITFLIFNNSVYHLMIPNTVMRYFACSLFLLLLLCFYFLALKLRQSMVSFPFWFRMLFLTMVLSGTFAITWLLGNIGIANLHSDSFLITCIILYLLAMLMFLFFNMIYTGILYQRNTNLMNQSKQQELEKEQYHNLTDMMKLLRGWKHDFRQHLTVLKELLTSGRYSDAQNYLDEIDGELNNAVFATLSGNLILDAILSSKIALMKECNIDFQYSLFLTDKLPLENSLLVAMIGNMFDNAITASRKVSGKRQITLRVQPQRNMLLIALKNSSNGDYKYDSQGKLKTQKTEPGHGLGLQRIRQIAEDAGGFCQIEPLPDSFLITVALPLPIEETQIQNVNNYKEKDNSYGNQNRNS